MKPDLVRITDAAREFNLSRQGIYWLIARKKVRAEEVYGVLRVDRHSLDQYLKTHGRRREKK